MNFTSRLLSLVLLTFALPTLGAAEVIDADVCIYGGTCAGVAAAVQTARMGKKAVLTEFGQHLGGLTTGGLGATDIGNKGAIGGILREFYSRIARHYASEAAWKLETRQNYFPKRSSGQAKASDLDSTNATMWTFEPHVAEAIFSQMLQETRTPVYFQQRLAAVRKEGGRITEIRMENGAVFRARMYIDASYEGDLMAQAKVSYHVGREANSQYGETLNGVRAQTPSHQFKVAVDPYLKPGEPSSGLLPFIQAGDGGQPGQGDRCVQAYNIRLCFTTNAANRMAITPPPNYSAARYELLARYLEALVASGHQPQMKEFWNPIAMPTGKTDINNNGGFSTDFIGANYDYPEGDYKTRERIRQEHEDYIRGFLTFLATSPRVPESMRAEMQKWGPCQDEFVDTGGWPHQLYLRETRRMISDYVMNERHCRGTIKAEDPVGLGAYNMDSHNCQRLVKNGRVENEGDVQVGVKPYPISYRSIVPKASECENLFVPVCLAASHIAYGSIRMEPVFMILGQSAATAASLAIDEKVSGQQVSYPKLHARLQADHQVLEWSAAGASVPGALQRLKGIVLDDSDGVRAGAWVPSNTGARQVGAGYIHDGNSNKGEVSIMYSPDLPRAGEYEIILISPPHPNRASNVPVTVSIDGREMKSFKVNQKLTVANGFHSLGKFNLPQGKHVTVTISNKGTDGYVVADGVQFLASD